MIFDKHHPAGGKQPYNGSERLLQRVIFRSDNRFVPFWKSFEQRRDLVPGLFNCAVRSG
jgi:hypothetical protein